MSRCLTDRAIDHVVLERGEVAHSWRTERWDSLRLLTPNWQSRLPGFAYRGDDPDGYRTLPEVIDFITAYAQMIAAPVRTRTTVTSVRRTDDGYRVCTDRGDRLCRTVVLASGACNIADIPRFADRVPRAIAQLTAQQYRRPDQLADGGVLVVGASSSGTQIAHEVHKSGRPVTLSIGEHIRAPRVYRGKDLEWWMDAAGVLDERYDAIDDIARARRVPSLQLAGTPDRSTLDLNALTAMGVKLIGRLAGFTEDGKAQFAGSLHNMCALSDLKMGRLLDLIDDWARANGLDGKVEPASADARRGGAAARHGLYQRPGQNDHLGDWLPARPFVARSAGFRWQGRHPPRWRDRLFARHVSDGHAVPAPAKIRVNRRRRRRRARTQRPYVLLSRPPCRALTA
jgi:putative flavoprotein involved in K+ transport